MDGEVRSNMEPPDSEEADTSLSDLTVLGCVQGEADIPEIPNIGPSACLPLGPRLPLPCHVFPGSLHFQIGGSWAHVQHVPVLDTSVCAGPSHSPSTNTHTYSYIIRYSYTPTLNYHLPRKKALCCLRFWITHHQVLRPDGWHCCVIIITHTIASQEGSQRSQCSSSIQ